MSNPRNILITGASTGIGRATATLLAKNQMQVFAGVRKERDAESLRSEGIRTLHPVIIDVTDEETIDAAIAFVGDQVGEAGLYGLINNAGVALGGPIEFLEIDVWRKQFDVNVIGTITMVQRSLPLLRQAENSRIINVGSIAGLIGAPLIGPYSASKHAVEAFTSSLRLELARWNIFTTVVAPGNVNTPIWDKAETDRDALLGQLGDLERERYGQQIIDMCEYGVRTGRKGVSAEYVAAVIERALMVRRPKHRYLVGKDAWFLYVLNRWLPRRLYEFVLRKRFSV